MEKSEKGITAIKNDDFSEWYQQLITKADLADYTAVSGCIVFKPRSYQIWENVVSIIDQELKKIGVQNAYFPLLIPESLLSKEKDHVKGFTPEVAWVTETGDSKLNERLAVRPTSEAIMYDSFSKWIRSYRDLPLRINQWNNVLRWEFKHAVPFLRTREFLWNEGHHAYADEQGLNKDRDLILGIYYNFAKDYMALPGLLGKKTKREKFAGAKDTYSIEFIIPNGKAIQGPDFHDDGQNFAKAYDIKFLDQDDKEKYVYQATYAITTRVLGIMFAVHSDDKGLIIPPRLAVNKIVIIPILGKDNKKMINEAEKIMKDLSEYKPFIDDRDGYKPGWKFNEWEMKGIPLRIEIGPKDIEKKSVVIAKRTGGKIEVKTSELKKQVEILLNEMHEELYKKAEKLMKDSIEKAESFNDLKKAIENKKVILANLCDSEKCEESIKEDTGAKTLNMQLKQDVSGKKCIICKKNAAYQIYIGKSY